MESRIRIRRGNDCCLWTEDEIIVLDDPHFFSVARNTLFLQDHDDHIHVCRCGKKIERKFCILERRGNGTTLRLRETRSLRVPTLPVATRIFPHRAKNKELFFPTKTRTSHSKLRAAAQRPTQLSLPRTHRRRHRHARDAPCCRAVKPAVAAPLGFRHPEYVRGLVAGQLQHTRGSHLELGAYDTMTFFKDG